MKNVVKLALVTGSLLSMASSAFAGLTLCSKSGDNIPQIRVKCGPLRGPLIDTNIPINTNTCTIALPWSMIRGHLDIHTGLGECDFFISGTKIASAQVNAQANSGTLSNVVITTSDYTTDPNPTNFPISGSSLKVSVEKKTT